MSTMAVTGLSVLPSFTMHSGDQLFTGAHEESRCNKSSNGHLGHDSPVSSFTFYPFDGEIEHMTVGYVVRPKMLSTETLTSAHVSGQAPARHMNSAASLIGRNGQQDDPGCFWPVSLSCHPCCILL